MTTLCPSCCATAVTAKDGQQRGKIPGSFDVRVWDSLATALAWVVVMLPDPRLVAAVRAGNLYICHHSCSYDRLKAHKGSF